MEVTPNVEIRYRVPVLFGLRVKEIKFYEYKNYDKFLCREMLLE
jgi:hypothetical protein